MTAKFVENYMAKPAAGGGGISSVWTHDTVVATTSGSSKDFTIPDGTTRIVVTFHSVSTAGAANLYCRLGSSSTIQTTGYDSWAYYIAPSAGAMTGNTTAMHTPLTAASNIYHGTFTWTLHDPATDHWVCTLHSVSKGTGTSYLQMGTSDVALSAGCDILRFMTSASSFDAGSVNVHTDTQ
jgi:hypothetical protein